MGEKTSIAWTDATFNGWIGCKEAGPGCDGCYARELDRRFLYGVKGDAARDAVRAAGIAPNWQPGVRFRTSPGNWKGPVLWNAQAERLGVPRKVFCNSLSDVFDNEVPDQWRADLLFLMKQTPWLRWQVLTKRIPNIRKMLPRDWGNGYPNVGLVGTVVTQDEWDRDRDRLLDAPARWHGFSLEPQIENIQLVGLSNYYTNERRSIWIITGGESRQKGHEPRPYNFAWARSLIREASIMPGMVSVFVKQSGAEPIGSVIPADGAGDDPALWPEDVRVRDFIPELLS